MQYPKRGGYGDFEREEASDMRVNVMDYSNYRNSDTSSS